MSIIAIRADASYEIGIGHVMRCITLAKEIKKKIQANIFFICRKADGCAIRNIKEAGFECIEMSNGVDNPKSNLKHGAWLRASQESDAAEFKEVLSSRSIWHLNLVITDHYGIDHVWQKEVKYFADKIFTIDDLGDRKFETDFLLDQTYNCQPIKYQKLVNPSCKFFLGTKYALLRNEFEDLKINKTNSKNLLVMFGGTDPDNLTCQALNIVCRLELFDKITVIINDTAKYISEVSGLCDEYASTRLLISPNNIAEIMQESTLAIGAAGTTSWERCAAGLPTVVIIQAFNQREIASSLEKAGVISAIDVESIDKELTIQIKYWLELLSQKNNVAKKCQNICDGLGARRVVKEILNA